MAHTVRQHAIRLHLPLIRARALSINSLALQYAEEYDKDNPDKELLDGIDNLIMVEISGLNLVTTPDPHNERDNLGKPIEID